MMDFIRKLSDVEKEIAAEKGAFSLFGIFHRETALPNRWDIVVSAPWLGENEVETLNYLFDKFRSRLSSEEMVMISAVILLKPSEPFVKEIVDAMRGERGKKIVSSYDFNGMTIAQGVIVAPKSAKSHEVKNGAAR